jgi:hypothetical protein
LARVREGDTLALAMASDGDVIASIVATDSAPSQWDRDQATLELPSVPFSERGTTHDVCPARHNGVAVADQRRRWALARRLRVERHIIGIHARRLTMSGGRRHLDAWWPLHGHRQRLF